MFDEVGDLSRYLNSFKVEVKKLKKTIEEFKLYNNNSVTNAMPSEGTPSEAGNKNGTGKGVEAIEALLRALALEPRLPGLVHVLAPPPKSAGRPGI